MNFLVTAAAASDVGGRTNNCDATAVHYGPRAVAAAVVDGIGDTREIARTSYVIAEVVARVGARLGATAGMLAGHEIVARSGPDRDGPDAVGAVAVVFPDGAVGYSHVGDCRVWSYGSHNGDRDQLVQHTVDHTVAELLRTAGVPAEQVARTGYEDHVRTTFGRATIGTVVNDVVDDVTLVILTSDGVHKVVPPERIAELAREHRDYDDPQLLADALLVAALVAPVDDGVVKDNVTAVVLRISPADGDQA